MVNRGLHLLNTRNVIGAHDDREIRQRSPLNFTSVVTKQGHRQYVSLASLFQCREDISRAATGGNSYRHIPGAGLRNELPEENYLRTNIIRDCRDVCGLERKRDRGYRPVPWRRKEAIQRPIV